MPPTEGGAQPRSARGSGPSMVPWEGCALVEVDPKTPKYIPANASVVLKVELKGWMDIGDDVQECRLGQRVPLEVIANLEFTRDDLHRRYGPGFYFVHAYVAGDGEKGTTLGTPIMGQTHEIAPCDFDNAKDSDPEDEEDDVGTQAWRVPPSATVANPELKEEIARRREVRRELGIGEEKRGSERDRGRGGRLSARGGRGSERDHGRGGRGGREWGPDAGDDLGRGLDDVPEEPEEIYDPQWMPPEAPPGMKWYFCGSPIKWRLMPVGSAPAQAVAPAEPKPSFFDTPAGAAVLTGALGALATIGQAMLTRPPPPDPMAGVMTLLATLQSKQADPERLKQLDIEAEDRRARAALEAEERRAAAAKLAEDARIERETSARLAAAQLADAQRAHEAKLEADRREAARLEAIAADERARLRAKEDQERLIALERMGLAGQRGPTPEQAAAEKHLAVMQAQIEWMRATPKSPDVMEAFEKAKSMLTKFGLKVEQGEDAGSALVKALETPMAAALATGIAPGLNAVLLKFAGGAAAEGAPTGPTPEQIDAFVRQRQEEAYRAGLAQAQAEAARVAAAAQGMPGVPAPEQMAPAPPMEPPAPEAPTGWQAVEQPAPPVESGPAVVPEVEATELPQSVPTVVPESAPTDAPQDETTAVEVPETPPVAPAPEEPPVDEEPVAEEPDALADEAAPSEAA